MLIGALFLTIALVIQTAWREHTDTELSFATNDNTSPKKVRETATTNLISAKKKDVNQWERDPWVEVTNDPFKVVSFLPPAPKIVAPPPPPPPKPVAPSFPYQYFGRMTDMDGKSLTFLTNTRDLISVKEKQTIDNVFEIESISETQLVINYLPLHEKQTIFLQTAENK